MGPFRMVLGIVFLIVAAKMFSQYLKYKSENLKTDNEINSSLLSRIDKQEKKIDSLENRIESLESIITSEEFKLDQKFKNL